MTMYWLAQNVPPAKGCLSQGYMQQFAVFIHKREDEMARH